MKRCSECKETKPFEMFSKNRSRKDGYQSCCKDCEKAYREANKEKIAKRDKAYKEANKEKYAEYRKAYYEANKEKYAEQNKAYYEANKEKYAEQNKAYYEANKEKIAEQNKAYREANKEKIAEYRKAYREANKEKLAKRDKAYREANKEKISEYGKAHYEANKEKYAENGKAYREANKEKISEYTSRHRARKRNAIPKFLRNCEIEKQRLRDIYKLRNVLSVATGIEHHVDHMWPLSDGGPHWSGNLQIITAQENLTKQAKVCKLTKKNIRDSLSIARKEYEDSSNGHRDR